MATRTYLRARYRFLASSTSLSVVLRLAWSAVAAAADASVAEASGLGSLIPSEAGEPVVV